MKTQWNIENLIDLEYFLHINAEEKKKETRDRDIFLRHIQPHLSQSKSSSRRFIIKAWLDQCKKTEKGSNGRDLPAR